MNTDITGVRVSDKAKWIEGEGGGGINVDNIISKLEQEIKDWERENHPTIVEVNDVNLLLYIIRSISITNDK